MSDPVDKSTAESGEIADCPTSDEIFNATLRDEGGEATGYFIKWRTSPGAFIMADEDSYTSLDANM